LGLPTSTAEDEVDIPEDLCEVVEVEADSGQPVDLGATLLLATNPLPDLPTRRLRLRPLRLQLLSPPRRTRTSFLILGSVGKQENIKKIMNREGS
jgi:hypothetical protein